MQDQKDIDHARCLEQHVREGVEAALLTVGTDGESILATDYTIQERNVGGEGDDEDIRWQCSGADCIGYARDPVTAVLESLLAERYNHISGRKGVRIVDIKMTGDEVTPAARGTYRVAVIMTHSKEEEEKAGS